VSGHRPLILRETAIGGTIATRPAIRSALRQPVPA